ncbi:hypothetical protein PXH78_23810, partial [Mycolicibacterium smegmatis]|uniref:hypothetical protein n=1 Tax=Mycolicibacterium smegmatis TaxID=1772 RepID=UPI0023DAFC9F
GSVRHVEVFQMDGVGTSIIGRPRPLSRHRRADDLYTLNCEEPDYVDQTMPEILSAVPRWSSEVQVAQASHFL